MAMTVSTLIAQLEREATKIAVRSNPQEAEHPLWGEVLVGVGVAGTGGDVLDIFCVSPLTVKEKVMIVTDT